VNIKTISSKKPSICFVAHFAYGALSGSNSQHIGGVEQQQSMIAKWLASRGYSVSMLTWDEGYDDGMEIDGVRLFKICPQDSGRRGIRFFHPRWTGLVRAMKRANADIYYQNCGECVTGQVAAWCRLHRRKFVYSMANDADVDPALPEMKYRRERFLYTYGLRHANCVIAQTQYQQRCLSKFWDINSTVIPMPCTAWPNETCQYRCGTVNNRILWVGRIVPQKRFEWLIEIARLCPDLHFDVAGHANIETEYSRSLEARIKMLDNVVLHGVIPHDKLYKYYRSASLLLCTSRFEGFPNTFLEAWSLGLPVVSTFDPDHLIETMKLGKTANEITGVIAAMRELLTDESEWNRISAITKKYFRENHSPDVVMPQYERIFLQTQAT
jgi:glycosyltransferase involved in cell wall biosynthesis